jgi:uncharacterized protein (DUF1697 family)
MFSKNDVYLALLRGINVGGKNKVNMADLKACFEKLGYGSVQTYGNSGNVIFTAASTDPRELESHIEKAFVKNFSSSIGVFIRSLDDMKEVMEEMPKDWQTSSGRKYDIIFLRHTIDNPKIVHDLGPKPGIEELHYRPGVLFWSVNIRDFSKSNMSKIVGTDMYQDMTIRGPSTIRKVYELMSRLSAKKHTLKL